MSKTVLCYSPLVFFQSLTPPTSIGFSLVHLKILTARKHRQSCCVSTSAYQYHCESLALLLTPFVAFKDMWKTKQPEQIIKQIKSLIWVVRSMQPVQTCHTVPSLPLPGPPELHSCGMCAYVRLHTAAGFLLTHNSGCASDNTGPIVHQRGDTRSPPGPPARCENESSDSNYADKLCASPFYRQEQSHILHQK